MIRVSISDNQLERAKELYDFKELKESYTSGRGNLTGAIGEIVVTDILREKGYLVNTESSVDYDLSVLVGEEQKRVEVKSCNTTVTPEPHFNCSVFEQSKFQECDIYIFTRVNTITTYCWVLGSMSNSDFWDSSTPHKEGSPDGEKFKFAGDGNSVQVKNLDQWH